MSRKSSKVISKAICKRRFERKLRKLTANNINNNGPIQLNIITTLSTLPPQLTNNSSIHSFFYGVMLS
ncbi:hypothetical protein RIR_jg34744.t1 [Rhizophagus irregularis DAOM 181602=DAOM 197198]|nr:hypothetical protein RIR_jg34744.t1 [Rhizophagus irregularis DAOM 181602=DAOM 197198]